MQYYYAVRGIQNKKLRYVYIAGMSLILSSLTIVCAGCLNAVRNIDREPEVWGFIRTDIYVSSLEGTPVSVIMDELRQDPNCCFRDRNIGRVCFSAGLYAVWNSRNHKDSRRDLCEAVGE